MNTRIFFTPPLRSVPRRSPSDVDASSARNGIRPRTIRLLIAGGSMLFLASPTSWAQGSVVGWRASYFPLNVPPGLTNAVAAAAAPSHNLVLMADGRVVGWGDDTYGKATVSPGLASVVEISAGTWHSMALKSDGELIVWGQSAYGQTAIPPGLSNVVAIAAGGHHCVALTGNGKVFSWGLGAVAPPNLPPVVAVAAGYEHSLALTSDGTVVSWGLSQRTVPADLRDVVAIAGGHSHSLALKADGTVVSWGSIDNTVPWWLSNVVAIAAGQRYSLALRRDGTIVSFGDWPFYPFPELSNVVTIAGGPAHSLAVVGGGPASPPWLIGPFSQRAYRGATATLRVRTKGSTPAGYQWWKSGVELAAQTNSSLTISNVDFLNAGAFSVVLRGSFGMITSRVATLRVVDLGSPEIRADGEGLLGNVIRANQSTISMSTAFPNGNVFYTTNGSVPTFASEPYLGPFVIEQTTTLRAIAYNLDFSQSAEDGPWQVQIDPTFGLTRTVRGSGTIQASLNSTQFFHQASVELLAYPDDSNWRFVRWEGDACGHSTGATILMDANKTATAVFERIPFHWLNVTTAGGGTVSASGYQYEGTLANVNAQPAAGWQFVRWEGDAAGNSPQLALRMDGPKNLRAIFGTTVSVAVGGSGSLALYPPQGPYPYGSALRLAARPSAGHYFAVWGADASLRANPLDFIITNSNPTVSALFPPLQANAVNVFVDVDGQGTVAVSPNLPYYSPGSAVTLTATPVPGWRFLQWRGDASGTSSNSTITLDTTKTATAEFQLLPRYMLSTTTQGGGTILGNNEGSYPEGNVVNLTAQPTPGWTFLEWQGDASGSSLGLAVSMNQAKAVQAVFGTPIHLNVVGPGSVGVSPAQPLLAYGSTVRITATPYSGVSFTVWGNDADGSENPLDYLVTKANPSICALFNPIHQEVPSPISIALVPGGVRLRFTGKTGNRYDIQRASALTGPWTGIMTATAPANGVVEHIDIPLAGMSFYRIALAP